MPTNTARSIRSSSQSIRSSAKKRLCAPELADPLGVLEVGEHQDVEQFGAWSRPERVDTLAQGVLHLVERHACHGLAPPIRCAIHLMADSPSIQVTRKNGKTYLMSAVALYEAVFDMSTSTARSVRFSESWLAEAPPKVSSARSPMGPKSAFRCTASTLAAVIAFARPRLCRLMN
jgi:hypothetical protein